MTRLAAIHPEWANRDEPLGNDQTSAAGEVRTDDTKMVPPRWWPTAAPARKPEPPQIQPGQQIMPCCSVCSSTAATLRPRCAPTLRFSPYVEISTDDIELIAREVEAV
jgi:hypothetical protein